MSPTPSLLGIPLELRELIFRNLLPVLSNDCIWAYPGPSLDQAWQEQPFNNNNCPCNVWRNMAFSCLQLWHEVGGFLSLYAGTVTIYPGPEGVQTSTFQCLCRFSFFRPRFTVYVSIGTAMGFTSPLSYSTLLAVCRFLARIPSLPHVQMRLASDPRDPGPYWTTSQDAEKAALMMVAFLAPFRLLARNPVQSSQVSIAGGAVSSLWNDYPYLAGFANRICREMEGKEVPTPLSLELIPKLKSKVSQATAQRHERAGRLFSFLGLYSTRVRSRGMGRDIFRTAQRPELWCNTCGIELWYRDSMPRHLDLFHGGGGGMTAAKESAGEMVRRKDRRST